MARTRPRSTSGGWWSRLKASERIQLLGVVVAAMGVIVTAAVTLAGGDDDSGNGAGDTTGVTTEVPSDATDATPVTAPTGPFTGPTFQGVVDSTVVAPVDEPVGLYPAPTLDANSIGEAQTGERFTAVCQRTGQPMQDDRLRHSDIWTLIELPHGYAYISEIFFGRHDFVLDECPAG